MKQRGDLCNQDWGTYNSDFHFLSYHTVPYEIQRIEGTQSVLKFRIHVVNEKSHYGLIWNKTKLLYVFC